MNDREGRLAQAVGELLKCIASECDQSGCSRYGTRKSGLYGRWYCSDHFCDETVRATNEVDVWRAEGALGLIPDAPPDEWEKMGIVPRSAADLESGLPPLPGGVLLFGGHLHWVLLSFSSSADDKYWLRVLGADGDIYDVALATLKYTHVGHKDIPKRAPK